MGPSQKNLAATSGIHRQRLGGMEGGGGGRGKGGGDGVQPCLERDYVYIGIETPGCASGLDIETPGCASGLDKLLRFGTGECLHYEITSFSLLYLV